MKRIVLLLSISVLATLILGWVNLAEAQQGGKMPRVGYLSFGRKSPSLKPFRQGLRELGYVDGQNIVIVARSARDKGEAELVRLKVDVIVTSPGPSAIRAAQQATPTIPIVMGGIRVDPVEAGFVGSLARPGGNITGLTNLDSELHPKRLELLKEAFPGISRVTIIWSARDQKQSMKEVEAAGKALGVQIQSVVVSRGAIERTFFAIRGGNPEGLLVGPSGFLNRNRARFREFTAKRGLPTIYAVSRFVKAGGLMSYGTERQHLYRRVATYVDKILKGAKPADLPVEQTTKFDFIINLKTAKALGLTIPPAVLLQATKVIK